MLGKRQEKQRRTIESLPWSVVRKLTQLLDRPHPEHHNWSTLLAHTEVVGLEFTADQVANFQTIASRNVGSPTEAIFNDFMVRNVSTDNLYRILKDMGHVKGMELLKDYVSPHVLTNSDNTSTTQSTSTDHASSNGTNTTSSSNASGPYQYHPEIGPLPNNVPPTAYESTVLRVPQEHLHGISHDMAGHAHHSPSSASPSLYLSHTHSPCQSECFFSQHGTTPTFSSPPPPPYSPNIPPSLRNLPPSDPYHERFSPSPQSHHRDIPSSPYSSSNGTSPILSPHQWGMLDGVGPVPLRAPPPTTTPPSSNTDSSDTDRSSSTPSLSANSGGGDFKLSILRFSYADLSNATKIFTEGLVGHGAFGSVFRANIRGCGPFAIKKLHNRSEMQSEMEGTLFFEPLHQESFMLELQSLVKYKHRNILSLVAISDDGPRPCLVYEYMENGSLADCLLGKQRNVNLTWKLRMEIASQIADALNFLHIVNEPQCLVHGDVKSSNILLDKHLTPKLSDFGLARECLNRPVHVTTVSASSRVAMGTVAYMAPEFLRNSKPSIKTDVYAFGVVMLELFTGQAADDPSRDVRTLVYHLQPLFNDPDKNREMVLHEADVRVSWPPDTALGFFVIATFCLQSKPKKRPPMDQVRDQITMLLDEAVVHQPLQNLHITQQPYRL